MIPNKVDRYSVPFAQVYVHLIHLLSLFVFGHLPSTQQGENEDEDEERVLILFFLVALLLVFPS